MHLRAPSIAQGVQAFVWAVVFFLYLWLGMLAVIAFGIGLTFGFTFDTAPRAVPAEAPAAPRPARVPVDRAAADEPVTAERRSIAEADEMPAEEQTVRQPNP